MHHSPFSKVPVPSLVIPCQAKAGRKGAMENTLQLTKQLFPSEDAKKQICQKIPVELVSHLRILTRGDPPRCFTWMTDRSSIKQSITGQFYPQKYFSHFQHNFCLVPWHSNILLRSARITAPLTGPPLISPAGVWETRLERVLNADRTSIGNDWSRG